MIRAKFRCMSVTRRWNGETYVEMLPVTHRQSHTSGGEVAAKENLDFWEATPAGKIRLEYTQKQECSFEPGDYYYVDFEESPEGQWRLERVEECITTLTIQIDSEWGLPLIQSGHVQMSIDNKQAWPHFQGKIHSRWNVTLRFAEASDSMGA